MMFFFRSSDKVAVSDDHSSLTYRELNSQADTIASGLTKLGVSADSLVGLCMPRNCSTVVTLLGVLRAGGAYLPIEVDQPLHRLQHIVTEARPRLVLVQDRTYASKISASVELVTLQEAAALSTASPQHATAPPQSLAYVLYTSGSTGMPKGVGMTRAAARNVVQWDANHRCRSDRGAQLARLGWDVSFQEIFTTLLSGGHVVVLSDECRTNPRRLLDTLSELRIERIHLTPTILTEMAREYPRRDIRLSLQNIVTSGERLRITRSIRNFLAALDRPTLENVYGMTEIHNVTSMLLAGETSNWPTEPSAGHAIQHATVTILLDGETAPRGTVGEICVSGIPVSRGYHRSPRMTAARYVPAEPARSLGERLFHTGDRGRELEDGSIQVMGRADRQVKHHGNRIELADIEAAFLGIDGVESATVRHVERREDTPDELIGYYVTERGQSLDESDLRASLEQALPAYMVPHRLFRLTSLPLTEVGKVDHKALPNPPSGLARSSTPYEAPRSRAEAALAESWADVLGVTRVGVHDDFFALGGDSLLAARVISQCNGLFEPRLSVRRFFDARNIRQILAGAIMVQPASALTKKPSGAVLSGNRKVSMGQLRFWFLKHVFGNANWLNNIISWQINGPLDAAVMERALTEVTRRHPALRETVDDVDGEVTIVRRENATIELERLELPERVPGCSSETAARYELCKWMDRDTRTPLRGALLTTAPGRHILALALNHMSSDAISERVLAKELSQLYATLASGGQPVLPLVRAEYADYVSWQRTWLDGSQAARQLAYWRRALDGMAEPTLPTDHPRRPDRSTDGRVIPFTFDQRLGQRVAQIVQDNRASFFMFLAAAFQILLSRYAGQDDVAVGIPVAARGKPEFDDVIGLFANTVVLRSQARPNMPFNEFLREVRETTLKALENQEVPFDLVVHEHGPHRDLSRNPLFDVVFSFDNLGPPLLRLGGLYVQPFPVIPRTTQFDLEVHIGVRDDGTIGGHMIYASDLFEEPTISQLVDRYERVLRSVADQPAMRLGTIQLTSPAEREKLVNPSGTSDHQRDQLVHELFEHHASITPHHVAVIDDRQQITYQSLNHNANQLAHQLRDLGSMLDKPIAVLLPRSVKMATAVLAILKVGGVYLPLDPGLSDERIRDVLARTRPALVIATTGLARRISALEIPRIILEEGETGLAITNQPHINPDIAIHVDNLATVIHTAASAGRHHAVALPHRALYNTVTWSARRHHIRSTDRILCHSRMFFGTSIWEMLAPLSAGATLLIAPDGPFSGERVMEYCAEQKATILFTVPSMLNLILNQPPPIRPNYLRLILTGGEMLSSQVCRQIAEDYGARIDISYGVSECAVFATAGWWEDNAVGSPSIGTAVDNVTAITLDNQLNVTPPGLRGILHLGGEGLARGYLYDPRLTAERFIPDPYSHHPGARLYITGDIARPDQNGNLEFIGRSDRQVRLAGHRFELEQVESAITELQSVDRAVVILDGPSTAPQLTCYVTPRKGAILSHAGIKQAIRDNLPSYMLPAHFVILPEMPVALSGKIDHARLRHLTTSVQAGQTF